MNRPSDAAGGTAAASAVRPFQAGDAPTAEPAFTEAWHAQALAVADSLIRAGLVAPAEWSATLGNALDVTQARQDDEAAYYAAVLKALETLSTQLEGMSLATLESRTEAWRAAYLSTPHGDPVELAGASVTD